MEAKRECGGIQLCGFSFRSQPAVSGWLLVIAVVTAVSRCQSTSYQWPINRLINANESREIEAKPPKEKEASSCVADATATRKLV